MNNRNDNDIDAHRAVIASELAWHDEEARRRFSLDKLLYGPPAFEQLVRSSFAFLQGRPGELVLDIGCGEGKETLRFARQGLLVVSMDLSFQQLSRARQMMQTLAPEAQVCFVQANAEEMPFAAGSFRIIYGKAILHHLHMVMSIEQVQRVLRQDGRATFAEPLVRHPLFWLARQLTPRLRTSDEHPMTGAELRQFGGYFNQVEMEAYFLVAPIAYVIRLFPGGEGLFRRLHLSLQWLDRKLFRRLRSLQEFAWYGLVKVSK